MSRAGPGWLYWAVIMFSTWLLCYALLVTWNLPGLPSLPPRHNTTFSRTRFLKDTTTTRLTIRNELVISVSWLFYNCKPVKAICDLLLPVTSNNRQGRAGQWQVGEERKSNNQSWPGDQTTTCITAHSLAVQTLPTLQTLPRQHQHHKCFSPYKLLFVL